MRIVSAKDNNVALTTNGILECFAPPAPTTVVYLYHSDCAPSIVSKMVYIFFESKYETETTSCNAQVGPRLAGWTVAMQTNY